MASAFFAVLRDISKLAASAADDLSYQATKMAAAADDVASMTGTAAAKTAGVAGDDLAVGAGQFSGVSPNRELPALWRITKGSAFNKVWLSAVLLLVSFYAPVLITVALVCGGLFLAYEGAHGLLETFNPHEKEDEAPMTEDEKVKGAIKTDMILSLEMLVIALASTGEATIEHKIAVLALIGILMTVGVYGIIGVIIRLDDMGIKFSKSDSEFKRNLGSGMVKAAPKILSFLGPVGMAAMFMVAGGIFSHLIHIEYPHWSLGAISDIIIGIVVGMFIYGFEYAFKTVRTIAKH